MKSRRERSTAVVRPPSLFCFLAVADPTGLGGVGTTDSQSRIRALGDLIAEEERDDTSPVPFLLLMAIVRRGQSHESEHAERLRTSSRPLARERSCQCCLLLSQLQPCRPRGRQLSSEVSAQGRPLRSPQSPDVRLRGSIGSPP